MKRLPILAAIFLVMLISSGCHSIEKPTDLELMQLFRTANLTDTLYEPFPKQIFKRNEGGMHVDVVIPNEESERRDALIKLGEEKELWTFNETSEYISTPYELYAGYYNIYQNINPTTKGSLLVSESSNPKFLQLQIGHLIVDTILNVIIKKEADQKNLYYVNYTKKLEKGLFYDYFYPKGQMKKYYYTIVAKEGNSWKILDHGFNVDHPILGDKNNFYDTSKTYIPTYNNALTMLYSNQFPNEKIVRINNITVHKYTSGGMNYFINAEVEGNWNGIKSIRPRFFILEKDGIAGGGPGPVTERFYQ